MTISQTLRNRVRRPSYLSKLAKAEDLLDLFPHNSYIGWSGFTGVGYPKFVFPSPPFDLSLPFCPLLPLLSTFPLEIQYGDGQMLILE